jgi:hypothetical protein
MKMKKILYTMALCLFTSVFTYAENLLLNPGFESVTEGVIDDWTITGKATITSDSELFQEGSKSLKGIGTASTGVTTAVYQYVEVTPGKQYDLSVWVYLTSIEGTGSGTGMQYEFADGEGIRIGSPISVTHDKTVLQQWTELKAEAVAAPDNAAYLVIRLAITRTLSVNFDKASVTEVGAVAKQEQSITGLSDMTKTVGDADFELTATASSGLAVSYASSNTDVATISGSTVHIVSAGSTTITASQAGDDSYEPAPDVTATLTVNPAPVVKQEQTVTGLSEMTKTVGDADFELTATASSGLAVSYASSNTDVATISGSTVHIVGAGTTTITASQAGNDAYNPASDVTATLTVNVGGAGIDEVKVQLPVRIVNGNLTVTAAPGSRIEVFSVVGSRCQSVMSAGGETVLSGLPKGQVLIVRSGHAVAKVIL